MFEIVFITLFYMCLVIVTLPVSTFSLQIVLALLPLKKCCGTSSNHQTSVAILVPAHNEASTISHTLNSIKKQVIANVRAIVIADNCTDNTAEIARNMGLEVIERFDETKRGKGYALDFGIQHLKTSPPDVVIVIDADCLIGDGAVNALVSAVNLRNRAIQGLYLIQTPTNTDMKSRIAEFAFVVKNWTRPLGFHQIGLPMQLTGSGMAFPWEQIKKVNLLHGSIVEDMKLGIDMAISFKPPGFCPEAYISSVFPEQGTGTQLQRKRWEHGHMSMIMEEGIPLLLKGIRSFNFALIAMALDLIVPPLALLFMFSAVFAILSSVLWVWTGDVYPWSYGVWQFVLFSTAIFLAWIKHGRHIVSLVSLLAYAPAYAVKKIRLYSGFFGNRQVEWIKSRKD